MAEIGVDWGTIAALFGGLALFGAVYNLVVAGLERRGYDEGYTALLVVVGVSVTLGAMALVDWRGAALALGCFAASGAPMVAGSWWRYVRRRKAGQDSLRRDEK